MKDKIIIKGAREHNLKNIDLEIPRNKFIVITGLSGSGKSSLAFDTIYAEGQRRYVESLSAYARQFLEQMDKPDVDSIEGLSPAISIEQKTTTKNPRSTVGTVTEIYDYLRLLFSRIGHPYCYNCGREITAQTVQQIVDSVMSLPSGTRFQVLAPIVRGRKGEYKKELLEMRKLGYGRARINCRIVDLSEDIKLNKNKKHNIEIIIDRLVLKEGIENRLADSLEMALRLSKGIVLINELDKERDTLYSEKLACIYCGISYPELTPRTFSFNSPHGACPECGGLGIKRPKGFEEEEGYLEEIIESLPCPSCGGSRLRRESLFIKINGVSIAEITQMSIKKCLTFLTDLTLKRKEAFIAERILKEIRERLGFLVSVGVDYLTLDRTAATLSAGEAQRIRLATQIGSSLIGVLYILDEPSIGLHQRDNRRLLDTLGRLRDLGNTVIVVEHDEETMRGADYLIDMGPGAGINGGGIVATGSIQDIMKAEESLTGLYLKGEILIPVPDKRRRPKGFLRILGSRENNLKGMDIDIPIGIVTSITGVSGSGKSTLVFETLYKALARLLYNASERPGRHRAIEGIELIDKVLDIDQSPIGRTPRSNPATYTGLFSHIRALFAQTTEARMRGYKPGRFSFNLKGGRCEACEGGGLIKITMHFLPDIYVTCDQCKGKRYNRETLDIKYKGKNIAEVLDMTVSEASIFFENIPHIREKLEILKSIGLGYITLGQSATTLSGGEAQRVKLSRELSKRGTGRTLYILDEPTTGLHFADIQRLLDVLNRLVDAGNTVIVIEHNLDVIKTADYIIDLGPEGGDEGGWVVAKGTPEEVSEIPNSYTGQFLKRVLRGKIETEKVLAHA
jgi:excinuclease ABC subunit A